MKQRAYSEFLAECRTAGYANDKPSGADENNMDNKTTRDGLNEVNDATQSRTEEVFDDVIKRNEATEYVRNEHSDWSDSAVHPTNWQKSLPDLSKGQKNDETFQEKILLLKSMRNIIQSEGKILSCPKYPK